MELKEFRGGFCQLRRNFFWGRFGGKDAFKKTKITFTGYGVRRARGIAAVPTDRREGGKSG